MSSLPPQSTTYTGLPIKEPLNEAFVGKRLNELRTPAFVIDQSVFARNCARMHDRAAQWGCGFRAHVKTHKTSEGTRLQLQSTSNTTKSVVVSTMIEAWSIVNAGLVADGTVDDILYGLPLAINKIADLALLADQVKPHGCTIRLMIDNPDQVAALETYNKENGRADRWSVFFKVDLGITKRAGLVPSTPGFAKLLHILLVSPAISLFGFYCHAGTSYASTSLPEASSWLTDEVMSVISGAKLALTLVNDKPETYSLEHHSKPFVLSVGSTPTAHAFSSNAMEALSIQLVEAGGKLELHAGNYPLCDLQQCATSLIGLEDVAQRILTSVIAYYPGRGEDGSDEAMCDAGGIAMSKDVGPLPGFGDVIGSLSPGKSQSPMGWRIGRMSQEHGILTRKSSKEAIPEKEALSLGDVVEVVGQHACMIAAAYPWYYVVDSTTDGEEQRVVDVWVPWKGW